MSAAPHGDDGGGAAGRGADAALAAVLEPLTAQEGQDMGPLLRPLARFINFGMGATAASNERKEGGEDGGGGEDGVGSTAGSPPRDTPDGVCAVALNMPPHLMPRPKIFSLTEEAVSLYARTPVLTNITYDGARARAREREMGQEGGDGKGARDGTGGEMGRDEGRENTLSMFLAYFVFRSLLTMFPHLVHHFRSFDNVPSPTHNTHTYTPVPQVPQPARKQYP